MTTQSETPRTDAARSKCRSLDDLYGCQPLEGCARTLERELSALTAQIAEARRDAERLRERANNLFGALLEFHNAFHNRGETTSLHEWNKRMKRADEHACQILPIPPSTKQ